MMKPTVIKSAAQYKECLSRVEELVGLDPKPHSDAADELQLLSLLLEDYEKRAFPIGIPDPVEAVLFRMHEQDLRQVDLIPYFGSRSRVSEFLSRQRPLTIQMVRDLSRGLGIPAEVLVQQSVSKPAAKTNDEESKLDWSKFPVREMISRGWINLEKKRPDATECAVAVRSFIESALGSSKPGVLARRTIKGDAFSWEAACALTAWQARVLERAAQERCGAQKFKIEILNELFFSRLIGLSKYPDGPKQALDFLCDAGIPVVVEKHLVGTKLDGAAMLSSQGTPVIGLTLRFDRVDNFWFTLVHELVHVWKHLSNPGDVFLDRLVDKESTERVEKEANRIARDLLISRAIWKSASVRQMPTKAGISELADELGIHPAIIAGRIRFESENHAIFSDMLGSGTVSEQVAEQPKSKRRMQK
jgi:HTH-type transcriptional regulator / antitoxin HigA